MQRLLAAAIGTAFCALGAGAVAAPRLSAGQYGVATAEPDALAFVRAAGARDLALGLLVLSSLRDQRALRRTLGWSSLVALADAAILFAARGARPSLAVHLAGFAALAFAARAEPA